MSIPARDNLPFMPAGTLEVMYLAFAATILVLIYALYMKFKNYTREPSRDIWKEVTSNFPAKLSLLLRFGLFQAKTFRKRYGGFLHAGIFYGVLVLFLGTFLVFLDLDILRYFNVSILVGEFYLIFEFVLDLFGLIFILGVLLAIFRRLVARPESLENRLGDLYILSFLLYIAMSGFVLEGLRLTLRPVPWDNWSPVGFSLSSLFLAANLTGDLALTIYGFIWWSHLSAAFILIATSPYTKLLHFTNSVANILLYSFRPLGRLTASFNLRELMERGDFDITVGVNKTGDFGWKQRLSFDACVDCGRCQEACPATEAGRELSPMRVVFNLKHQMRKDYKALRRGGEAANLIGDVVLEDEIWGCTTCGACVYECPVMINHIDYLMEFRRRLTFESRLDSQKTNLILNIANKSNPYGFPSNEGEEWRRRLGVKTLDEVPNTDYLYWIGCVSTFDPRAQKIAEALVQILGRAGVSFGILGGAGRCCGEEVRRVGEEGRFQQIVFENIEMMNKYDVKKILTHCPHCYNTLKNEYPEFGGNYEVIHHSQLLADLIEKGKVKPTNKIELAFTFHDPCYLGRYNGFFQEPRMVLASIPGARPKEMQRSQDRSLCCGGGGGNLWYEVPEQERISVIRTREVEGTGSDLLALACPYCMSMFEDASRLLGLEEKLEIKDIAEIIYGSLKNSD